MLLKRSLYRYVANVCQELVVTSCRDNSYTRPFCYTPTIAFTRKFTPLEWDEAPGGVESPWKYPPPPRLNTAGGGTAQLSRNLSLSDA